MWKFPALFLVFVYFSVKESNATSNDADSKVWAAGSAVNVIFGPDDAVYCKLMDNKNKPVFDGFGPCRVVVDRVTMDHYGLWELWTGIPGTVIVRYHSVFVEVVAAVDTTPRVTESVVRKNSMVIVKCAVPEEYEIMACTFSDPSGSVFIANGGVRQEGYNNVPNYESYVDRHDCTLALLTPQLEHAGIWRCSVKTARVTSHHFFDIQKSTLDHGSMGDPYHAEPVLQSTHSSIASMEGDAKTLSCSIDAAVRYCYFRAPNGTVYNVGPSTSSPGYEYAGRGFDAGDCGIRFNSFWASDVGEWTCNVGLKANFEEQRASIDVYVNKRLIVNHHWQGSSVVVRLRIFNGPELEYCRFVRSDGLSFNSETFPPRYVSERGEKYGVCALTISQPAAQDLRPWTIVAKVTLEDGEVSITTTLDSSGQVRSGLPRSTAILFWSFFGTIFIFLIAVSCLPKRNRDWTYQKAAHIRKSFRRQPQPQPQTQTQPQFQPHPQPQPLPQYQFQTQTQPQPQLQPQP